MLGPDVAINLFTYDETNQHVVPEKIIPDIKKRGSKALIAFVGVQSNQFAARMDMARPFLAAGLPVAIGGFHVSGCLSMLPEMPPEIQDAIDLGISIFAGECEEGRLDEVLIDAFHDRLKPIYEYLKDLPSIAGAPSPLLPKEGSRAIGGNGRASISAAAARSNAPSAPSSTSRAARAASVPPTISRGSSARIWRRGSRPSSSPTTISRATRTGRRSSTGSSCCGRARGSRPTSDPGRHALPPHAEFHRQGDAGRGQARLHRAREHQPGQSDRRQQAPEQDHRISRDAAAMA